MKDSPYNAVGDGVADDTAGIQAAIDAVGAAGGGEVLFPSGDYLCGQLTHKAKVALVGEDKLAARLVYSATTVTPFINVLDVSDAAVRNLVIDMVEAAGADTYGAVAILHNGLATAADRFEVTDCYFTGARIRPYIDLRSTVVSRGVRIENNEFVGRASLTPIAAPASQTTVGIRALTVAGCGDWIISDNTFRKIGMSVQIRHASTQALDQFDSITVSGNRTFDVPADPNISTSPYELFCITGLSVVGNTIHGGGRGFSGSFVKAAVYSGNSAYNQAIYFLELANSDGVNIVSNVAHNCKSFVNDTSGADPGSKNIAIKSNLVTGGHAGEASINLNADGFAITMVAARNGYEDWDITDNVFAHMKYTSSIIRINGASTMRVAVDRNVFIESDETQKPIAISVIKGNGVFIRGNRIYRTANVSDTTDATAARHAFIAPTPAASGPENVLIEDNEVNWSGTDTRTGGNNTGCIGIGANTSAAALPGLTVRRNRVIGGYNNPLFLQVNSGDSVVEDNDLSQATGTTTINAAIVYRRTKRYFESAAAPAAGTWNVGDYAKNSAPAVGQPKGWYCTVAGTPGTWVSEGNL